MQDSYLPSQQHSTFACLKLCNGSALAFYSVAIFAIGWAGDSITYYIVNGSEQQLYKSSSQPL